MKNLLLTLFVVLSICAPAYAVDIGTPFDKTGAPGASADFKSTHSAGTYTLSPSLTSISYSFTFGSSFIGALWDCNTKVQAVATCDKIADLTSAEESGTFTTKRRWLLVVVSTPEGAGTTSTLIVKGGYSLSVIPFQFTPDPSSPTLGLQALVDAACASSLPEVIEFADASYTADASSLTGTALSDGILDIPEKCNELTFIGQGPNTSKFNFEYTLDSTDDGSVAGAIDLKVVRIRGSRWIQFRNFQFAARNTCNMAYGDGDAGTTPNYPSSEDCIADGKILISIEAATDATPSRNIVFDNMHLHFPTTYDHQDADGFGVFPNAIRAVDSEEVHLTNSVVHTNGFHFLVDDCLSCTANYNWFGSVFPLSEGPVGHWHDPTPPYTLPTGDLTNADYTSETQGFIVLGVGEGKEAIGNRMDADRLAFEFIEQRTVNATGGVIMASVLDLTGEVPRGAIVANNSIYNVNDKSFGMVYFINYNGAMVTGNSVTCKDLVDPSNCEGGSVVRIINQAGAGPDDAYNRENVFMGNLGIAFPSDYHTGLASQPAANSSCITIYAPNAADQAEFGSDSHTDNTFIGNVCDSRNTIFAHNGDNSSVAGVDVINDQHWGVGNVDLSTGQEFGGGRPPLEGGNTSLTTGDVCNRTINDTGSGAKVITLPPISPEGGGFGCAFKFVNAAAADTKVCADGQYFTVLNEPDLADPNSKTGHRCATATNFQDYFDAVTILARQSNITSISLGTTTTIGYNAAASIYAAGDRVRVTGILASDTVELNDREFLVRAQSGTGGSATITLNDLDGNEFDSTGFTAWTSGGGEFSRYDWVISENANFVSAAP